MPSESCSGCTVVNSRAHNNAPSCLNHLMVLHAHLADVPTLMGHAVLGVRFIK